MLLYEHSQVPVISSSRSRGLVDLIATVRSVSARQIASLYIACTRCTLLALLCFCSRHCPFIVTRVSLSFAPISTFTNTADNCLCFCFLVLHLRPRLDSGSGVWGPQSLKCQSCKFAMFFQYRSRGWLRSNICAIFRCRHTSDSEISILNSSLYPEISLISVLVRGPALHRSDRERAVELPYCMSHLIGIPRSMCMDLKDSLTWLPFTTTLLSSKSADPPFNVMPTNLTTIPSCFFSRLNHPRNRCLRRL